MGKNGSGGVGMSVCVFSCRFILSFSRPPSLREDQGQDKTTITDQSKKRDLYNLYMVF